MSIGRIATPNVLLKSNYHSLDILLSGLCSTFYDNVFMSEFILKHIFQVRDYATFNSVRNLDFFSLARGAVGLNNLMKISLALVTFSLARLHFHWPRARASC